MRPRILPAALTFLLLAACGLTAPAATFAPERYAGQLLDIPYCSPGGLPQHMDAYFPSSGGPWPALVYVHGGGWVEGDKAEGAGWRHLTGRGYLVVSLNYRLATETVKFPAMIADVQCAIRHLRAHASAYNLDPERIGVLGSSAGGHLAALLGTAGDSILWEAEEYAAQSSRVQAVVTLAGLSDLTLPMFEYLSTAVYYAFGEPGGHNTDGNRAASPVTYIDAGDPPFLILHGDQDGIVPLDQAESLHARLTQAGVDSTLVVVLNGDHSLRGLNGAATLPSQEQILELLVAFLDRSLK